MKRITLLLTLVLSGSQFLSAQNITDTLPKASSSEQRQIYLEKSKHQKSAGITLLVVGGATMIVGAIGTAANVFDEAGETYAIVFLVGAGVSLGSIPLFIASHRNRNKASASLRFESIPLADILPGRRRVNGLGLSINF